MKLSSSVATIDEPNFLSKSDAKSILEITKPLINRLSIADKKQIKQSLTSLRLLSQTRFSIFYIHSI